MYDVLKSWHMTPYCVDNLFIKFRWQYRRLSLYNGGIQHDIEHNTKYDKYTIGRKLKRGSNYKLSKDTPYRALSGEL